MPLRDASKEGVLKHEQEATPYPASAIHAIRTAQQNHVQLSAMADAKASILMGAAIVVFTLALGHIRQGQIPPIAIVVLGSAALLAAVCAVFALLPSVSGDPGGKVNVLFFGSFHRFDEGEYLDRICGQLRDEEALYRMMARDLYQNGIVLGRKKYPLIGYAYRIFLIGLVGSFVAAALELAAHGRF